MNKETPLDAAQIGKMFVTSIQFQWKSGGESYDDKAGKYTTNPGHWTISATLADKPCRYAEKQTMSFIVEHGIGEKLVEILLPVVIADASRKAEQLAEDSKAMFTALGNRTVKCLADMPTAEKD